MHRGGATLQPGRVASGGCPPEAPTDPDVPNLGIRLVKSRVRLRAGNAGEYRHPQQRKTLRQVPEVLPRNVATTSSPTGQPFLPDSLDPSQEQPQRITVVDQSVIGVVAPHLLDQRVVLFRQRQVPVEPTPLSNLPECPAQAALGRFPPYRPEAPSRTPPEMGESQQLECAGLRNSRRSRPSPVDCGTVKRHQPCFVRMQRQTVFAKAFGEYLQHRTRVLLTG